MARTWNNHTFIRKFRGRFFVTQHFKVTFFPYKSKILGIKCENSIPKIERKLKENSEQLRWMERSSRNFLPGLCYRNFSGIFAPSNRYFTENSCWLPLFIEAREIKSNLLGPRKRKVRTLKESFTVVKGNVFLNFGKWPLNKGWPLYTGLTVRY